MFPDTSLNLNFRANFKFFWIAFWSVLKQFPGSTTAHDSASKVKTSYGTNAHQFAIENILPITIYVSSLSERFISPTTNDNLPVEGAKNQAISI